ncbi:hypothetical protein SAMD00019534_037690 [Acytostelium subglobosum LB1]|uniref:hypothetical protein n=1 Tax=Acytostelium subglobosum LB1 TaxID=1410327 RepID=UPI000644948A|nr:hypothetical protein SAMD00019534_037690 [Acytostelium subglobosum LB1]GAM20594.1 hypothetical protein SAMD00019534_037690 [Acytostelium subglobosum LB1]|eukprot:XP_012760115.1 hypothetical protein SAMD00019534_037690 [Acytostelium subglobosum LB1]
MHKNRICQLVSILVGLLLVAGGIIIWYVVNDAIHNTVYKATRALPDNGLDSSINPWTRFLTNKGDPDNQRSYQFNVYNLTNPAQFLAGANPIYQEVGPYTYASLFENWTSICSRAIPRSPTSTGRTTCRRCLSPRGFRDANTDTIYHFNLAYQTIVNKAGGERALSVGVTASIMAQYWAGVMANNATITSAANGVTTIHRIGEAVGANLMAQGGSLDAVCTNVWLQDATASTGDFPIGSKTTLNVTQCRTLLMMMPIGAPVSYGFFNKNPAELMMLLQAVGGSPAALKGLAAGYSQYGITEADTNLIVAYVRGLMINTVMNPAYNTKFAQYTGCSDCTLAPPSVDSVFAQFALQGGYLGTSINNIAPTGLPAAPEYGVMMNSSIPVASAKILMNKASTFNLVTQQGLGGILTLAAADNYEPIMAVTQLDKDQTKSVVAYINTFISTITVPTLRAKGVGIIGKHTVTQFLFNMTDPMLQMLFPTDPSMWSSNMVSTILDKEIARQTIIPDISWTGKADTNMVLAPITYKGDTVVVYKDNITVTGNAPEQLGPYFLAEHDNPQVRVFSSDYVRTLHLTKVESGALSGLPYYRYRVHPETYDVNEQYFTSIPYLLNISSVVQKPVYITRPRLQGLAPGYFAKAGLSDFIYNAPDNDVYVDYEPRTGKAINGRYSIQINAYIPGGCPASGYSPSFISANVTCDVVHPMFWGKNEVIAKPNQIDAILLAYKIDAVRYALTILLIAGGGFLILGAVGLFLFEHVKEKIL